MEPRHILVTGSTRGIGLETARALAAQGHVVWLHGRSERRGRAVIEQLQSELPDARLGFLPADFGSLAEVRRLADAYRQRPARLDVLVNNAGCACFSRQLTRDGFEATFAVNHLAPFLLTLQLLPMLLASARTTAPARIVNVASAAHRNQMLDFDDLMSERDYRMLRSYGRSKLANILFTRALARRLRGSGVTANALHPGVVRTRIGQNNALARLIGGLIMLIRGISPQEGARTSVYLASSEEVRDVSGEYFVRSRIAPLRTAAEALAPQIDERLWRVSEELVAPFSRPVG